MSPPKLPFKLCLSNTHSLLLLATGKVTVIFKWDTSKPTWIASGTVFCQDVLRPWVWCSCILYWGDLTVDLTSVLYVCSGILSRSPTLVGRPQNLFLKHVCSDVTMNQIGVCDFQAESRIQLVLTGLRVHDFYFADVVWDEVSSVCYLLRNSEEKYMLVDRRPKLCVNASNFTKRNPRWDRNFPHS